jgi:hypothetical protein
VRSICTGKCAIELRFAPSFVQFENSKLLTVKPKKANRYAKPIKGLSNLSPYAKLARI